MYTASASCSARGVRGESLHAVLDVDVQGEEHLVAEHLGAFRGDGIGRKHMVERVLDALQPHVVHADEAQYVGRQLALGVEARLFRLQFDAAQFAALARRADGCRPVGRNVALDVHEAVAVEQAPHLLRVEVQDVGEQRRRP